MCVCSMCACLHVFPKHSHTTRPHSFSLMLKESLPLTLFQTHISLAFCLCPCFRSQAFHYSHLTNFPYCVFSLRRFIFFMPLDRRQNWTFSMGPYVVMDCCTLRQIWLILTNFPGFIFLTFLTVLRASTTLSLILKI